MHLTLHLSRACNMRCSYCYAPPSAGPAMTERVAFQALEFGASDKARGCGIVFFGGEPLLHRALIERVIGQARCRTAQGSCSYHFKVTTNGLLLDEAFLELAVREQMLVAMSFDGVQPVQDRHRRLASGEASFERLRSRLELLLRYKPYSTVISVVNPDTVSHLSESVQYLMALGARYLVVSLNYAAPWTEADLQVLREQYEQLAELYLRWTRQGLKFYLSPFEVKLASHIQGEAYGQDRCELGKRQLSVDPEGRLYPCVQFTRAGEPWCLGDVFRGVRPEALGRIEQLSQADKEPCSRCAIRRRCNHTCGCLNWQTTGSVQTVSPVLCAHEQLLLPIADRVGELLYREKSAVFLHKHYNAAYPLLSLLEDSLVPLRRGAAR